MAVAGVLDLFPISGPGDVTLQLGPFVYMPLVLVLGPAWAVTAAGIAFLPSLWRLGHPFVLVVAALEALFLSLSRRWTSRHASLIDLGFWVVIGAPLLLWFNHTAADLPRAFSWIVVGKLAINQWSAVVIGHFLAHDTQLGNWIGARAVARERLRDLVFDYVFALALVPLFLVGAGMSVMLRRLAVENDRQVLTESVSRVAQQADLFLRSHQAAIETAARLATQTSADHTTLLRDVQVTHPAFITMLMTDQNGRIGAASPGSLQPSVTGTSVADREYFQAGRAGGIHVSHVFRGRGFGTDVLVAVSAPWYTPNGKFGGVVEGSLAVEYFGRSVVEHNAFNSVALVLADPSGRVIYAAPSTGLHPLSNLRHDPLGALLASRSGSLDRFDRYQPDHTRVFHVARAIRSPEFGVWVIAERPLLAGVASVAWIYELFALVMAGIVVGAILVARVAARRLSHPLEVFAQGTTALAERNAVEPLPPVAGPTTHEFALMLSAFNRLATRLRASYADLRQQNAELDTRVAERTRELEEARRAAEEASRSKSDFVAMTSHEIRTPLNAIVGLADMGGNEAADPAIARRFRTIKDAGHHLVGVVNDLLDLSRIEADKLEIVPGPVELGAFCEQIRALLVWRAEQQGLRLRLVVDPSVPSCVETDAGRLRQVLVNLLGNAIKFTVHGEVTLRVEAMPTGDGASSPGLTRVTFSVVDTGPGITLAEQARLFEPYVQLENARHNASPGSGLGLVISRRLVSLLGGELQLRSQPGAGSTFYFTLPLRRIDNDTPTVSAEAPAVARAVRALVADDNYANQEVMSALLDTLGAEATIVATAADAIDRLAHESFDVAFIDLEMPDADGFTVAETVRSSADRCRLVAFSAYSREQVIRRCQDAGFTDFLAKPVARAELKRILALARRPALAEA